MTKLFLRSWMRDAFLSGVSFMRNSFALIGLTLMVAAAFLMMRGNLQSQPVIAVSEAPGSEAAGFTTSFFSSAMALNNTSAHFVADSDTTESKAPAAVEHNELLGTRAEQVMVTRYLSRKYHVNADAADLMVGAAYLAGRDAGVDPSLMQVMSKIHQDMLGSYGGPNAALDPVANIRVGALILKDCIRRGGSVRDGLRLYVGSMTQDDGGYGARVLQEKDRILQAAHGGNPLIMPAVVTHAPSAPAAPSVQQSAVAASDVVQPRSGALRIQELIESLDRRRKALERGGIRQPYPALRLGRAKVEAWDQGDASAF
jgi:hypothetical protein